jgi:hypothetical protein
MVFPQVATVYEVTKKLWASAASSVVSAASH